MFTQLELENVRSWEKASIPLSPLTVLVGPNASGKTTILEALEVLGQAIEHFLAQPRGPAPDWHKLLRAGQSIMAIRAHTRSADGVAGLVELTAHRTSAAFLRVSAPDIDYDEARAQRAVHPQLAAQFVKEHRIRLYQFVPERLGARSYVDDLSPSLSRDGSNLASVLATMRLEDQPAFEQIVKLSRDVVPSLRNIQVRRANVIRPEQRRVVIDGNATQLTEQRTYVGHEVVFEMEGAPDLVRATEAGEGTLLVVGLITAAFQPSGARIALLDDIEMRLHPAAQAKLIEVLRANAKIARPAQIVGTTHSPFFLQHLDASEVAVVDMQVGRSSVQRLSEHPDYEMWRDTMGVGEFWSSVGEQWLRKAG
jgi:predicted ATPase